MLGKLGTPLDREENLIDLLQYSIISDAPADKIEVPPDDHQKIVEVVSQPTGQLADNLHFLCLVQQRFRALTDRDLVGQSSSGLSQVIARLSQLAQVCNNSTNDPAIRVAGEGR